MQHDEGCHVPSHQGGTITPFTFAHHTLLVCFGFGVLTHWDPNELRRRVCCCDCYCCDCTTMQFTCAYCIHFLIYGVYCCDCKTMQCICAHSIHFAFGRICAHSIHFAFGCTGAHSIHYYSSYAFGMYAFGISWFWSACSLRLRHFANEAKFDR